MQLGIFTFQPKLIPSIVVLLLLPLLLSLGFWQLDRAVQKQHLQTSYTERAEQPAITIDKLLDRSEEYRFQQVIISGDYDVQQQFLLDNKIYQGQAGFHVLTPLRMTGGAAILVNRGWIALTGSREQLPDIAVTKQHNRIIGQLSQPANPGIRLAIAEDNNWPRIVQHVDYQILSTWLGYPLSEQLVLLDAEAEDGYVRDWRPTFGGFGPQRHQGYAVQWFALALTLLIIYLVVNTRIRLRTRP